MLMTDNMVDLHAAINGASASIGDLKKAWLHNSRNESILKKPTDAGDTLLLLRRDVTNLEESFEDFKVTWFYKDIE